LYGTFNSTASSQILATSGSFGVGTIAPTARLHLPAGTATAGTAPIKLTTGTALTTPEPGAIETDGNRLCWTNDGLDRLCVDFTSPDSVVIADTTVAKTTVETTIVSDTQKANTLDTGKVVAFHNGGTFDKASSHNATIRVKIAGTTVGTITIPNGAVTGEAYDVTAEFVVRGTGAATQIRGSVEFASTTLVGTIVPISGTIDTTADQTIEITWQWSAAAVGTTVTSDHGWVEIKG